MGSTYTDLHVHVIFATKYRQPWIAADWRGRLQAYIAGTIRGLGAKPVTVGGTDDHVHLLIELKATDNVADLVRETKKAATKWVRSEVPLPPFAWQDGYAAFSVCADARDAIVRYIEDQETHHRIQKPIDELRFLLAQSGIVYDPAYLE